MAALVPLRQPEKAAFWAARAADDSEFTPEDPLALDYLGQQVGLWILPGLTTRTNRAHYYMVVLYGLHLAERAIERYGAQADDETRESMFGQWERFWALAVMESRNGRLERGDPDAMRGVRGASRAWFAGDRPLPLTYPLISRQSELGGLGAYLSSLRHHGLVIPGTLRPSPAAEELLAAMWDEPGGQRIASYDQYALDAMEPGRKTIDRKRHGLTLARLGAQSRLSSLVELKRAAQQDRLWRVLFEEARDPVTYRLSELVRLAAMGPAPIWDVEAFFDAALDGRWGTLDGIVREHLSTARAFAHLSRTLLGRFNAIYGSVWRRGFTPSRTDVASDAFPIEEAASLRAASTVLLDSALDEKLRALPLHGHALVHALDAIRSAASGDEMLAIILEYHHRVQHERRRGDWLRAAGDRIVLDQTGYNGHRGEARLPNLKIPAVQQLLRDLGRIG